MPIKYVYDVCVSVCIYVYISFRVFVSLSVFVLVCVYQSMYICLSVTHHTYLMISGHITGPILAHEAVLLVAVGQHWAVNFQRHSDYYFCHYFIFFLFLF